MKKTNNLALLSFSLLLAVGCNKSDSPAPGNNQPPPQAMALTQPNSDCWEDG